MEFSDLGLLRGISDSMLPVGPIDGGRMTQITRDLVRSFLDEQLGKAPMGTFAEAVARYPELG
jgi:hypothetical protein